MNVRDIAEKWVSADGALTLWYLAWPSYQLTVAEDELRTIVQSADADTWDTRASTFLGFYGYVVDVETKKKASAVQKAFVTMWAMREESITERWRIFHDYIYNAALASQFWDGFHATRDKLYVASPELQNEPAEDDDPQSSSATE